MVSLVAGDIVCAWFAFVESVVFVVDLNQWLVLIQVVLVVAIKDYFAYLFVLILSGSLN